MIERTYGHRTTLLAAHSAGRIRGVLPLTLVTSHIFGRHLVSMPFLDYGGVATDGDDTVAAVLVDEAIRRASAVDASLELRQVAERAIELPASLDKVTMLLPLLPEAELQWKSLRSERRNRIRKGERLGLEANVEGLEGVSDFYAVLSRNMRDLGSPVHPERFYSSMIEVFGQRARALVVRSDGVPIGACMMLAERDRVSIPWVSSLREYFDRCPNQVLYWSAIRHAISTGATVLDFGRSSRDAGTFEAKRQWGAEPHQLYWYYAPETSGPSGEDVGRFQRATELWRRLPMPVANRLGPIVRKSIPN